MPFPLIPAALGVCFVLVWALVGGMIFRDSQLAADNERDANLTILPLMPQRPIWQRRSKTQELAGHRAATVRAAS
jgi:hypothetical protein